jgi:4-hydroxy-tetrahydrodipicolinate synthase
MMTHPLAGVYAAAVTPLNAEYSPDLEAVPPLLDFLARRGCHGALLLGTTGEGPSFAPEEREAIFRAALKVHEAHRIPRPGFDRLSRAAQGKPFKLLAGTGTPSLTETVSLTRLAFDLGFDGVVVLPPYYFRKVTEAGLFAYFAELIRRAVPADGRLFYYHFPALTGIQISLDLLARLRDAFPKQFIGIKDSSGDAENVLALGNRFGREFMTMIGTEKLFQRGLENNASGCITAPANLLSPDLRRAWDTFEQGGEVAPIQAGLTAQRTILEKYSPFPPILKALLARQHGFPQWPVRPPLEDVGEDVVEQARKELEGLV